MTPLIYIHKGFSWYVPLALRNGKSFGDEVIYLGDSYGCAVARASGVKAVRMSNYQTGAEAFAAIYQHHSELGANFELFCIKRWFILAEFLQKSKLERCVYLDTDVLLTRRIDPEVEATKGFPLNYTGYSAHTCIVHSTDVLASFCEWIMDLYNAPGNEKRFRKFHASKLAECGDGGVSDMTLFYWFQQENPNLLGDYPAVFGNSPFDVSLEEIRGFVADEDGFKKLVWEGGFPNAIRADGSSHPLCTLHFQGRAKRLIRCYGRKLGLSSFLVFGLAPTYRLIEKLIRLFFRSS